MNIRKLFLACAVAAGLASGPTLAASQVNLSINVGPPPPIVEVVPAPRAGYVWGPGYWRWNGHKHVWANGRWMRAQHGRVWVPEHWDQRGAHWVFVPGHWVAG